MQLNNNYNKIYGKIPIFGMIHLAGEYPVQQALKEIKIFEQEGVDAAIIENYHNHSVQTIIQTFDELAKIETSVSIGVNVLPNEFYLSLPLAQQYGADFIQLDHVAGTYGGHGTLLFSEYQNVKERNPDVIVLGGVHPKYYHPVEGSDLEEDLKTGMQRAEAIVVTGEGTGMATPIDKIKRFREVIGDHPLVVGAGLTPDNAYEQLCISDGAIVGSSLKLNSNTHNPIDRQLVREFISVVREARNYQENRK